MVNLYFIYNWWLISSIDFDQSMSDEEVKFCSGIYSKTDFVTFIEPLLKYNNVLKKSVWIYLLQLSRSNSVSKEPIIRKVSVQISFGDARIVSGGTVAFVE